MSRKLFEAKPIIGITLGDPSGIGPEVAIKAATSSEVRRLCVPLLIGSPDLALKTIRALWLRRPAVPLSPIPNPKVTISFGRPSPEAGRQALQAIHSGVTLWERGKIEALVTAPVSKESLRLAGSPFPGHTELLAHLTRTRKVAMMFASDRLRVVLATTHVSYLEVPKIITSRLLREKVLLAEEALRTFFGVKRPRIAVCGLNPHAGEGGRFGREERDLLVPAIKAMQRRGLAVSGPHAADALFSRLNRTGFDAVLALYHDQGLIPIKALDARQCVNLTLGLPLVRTSPGHGTAYDLAGKGLADPASTIAAVQLAAGILERMGAAIQP